MGHEVTLVSVKSKTKQSEEVEPHTAWRDDDKLLIEWHYGC